MLLTEGERAGFNLAGWTRARLAKTGLTNAGQRVWSRAEVDRLALLYPDYAALRRALPGRTLRALQHKASRLGISRSNRAIWTEAQSRELRPRYMAGESADLIGADLGPKSAQQVRRKARRLRLRRPRKPPVPLGEPTLDAIRGRAFALNMTLVELGRAVGRDKAFHGHKARVRWPVVERALRVLGGRPAVRWDP